MVSSLLVGVFSLIYILRFVYSNSFFASPAVGTQYYALEDFLIHMPIVNGMIEQIKRNIISKAYVLGDAVFESHVSELKHDLQTFLRTYLWKKFNKMLKMIMASVFSVILIFGCLYVVDYLLECWLLNRISFSGSQIPTGNTLEILLDAVYYSVSTFSTLGFGDVHPGVSIFARILAISEVMISLFFLSVIVSLTSDFIQLTTIVNPEDLAEAIKDELEDLGGGVI
jgi:hypothetical protein